MNFESSKSLRGIIAASLSEIGTPYSYAIIQQTIESNAAKNHVLPEEHLQNISKTKL